MDAISQAIDSAVIAIPSINHRLDEPMRNHTSFKIGGCARAVFFPDSAEDLTTLCSILYRYDVDPLVIGNGTNLLINDTPLDRFIVKTTSLDKITLADSTEIVAGAGVPLAKLAMFAYEKGLTGLEFAHGIPGTLGGAITMNAGAYGGEMKDCVLTTEVYSIGIGLKEVKGDAHEFSYRQSRFCNSSEIILASTIGLRKSDKADIRGKMEDYASRRRESQPLDMPSAGSVFKRPNIDDVYAASLIERACLKGYTVGGAQVSVKHSGFIVNVGGATFSDVTAVIDHVRETVFAMFGVDLKTEIKIIRD